MHRRRCFCSLCFLACTRKGISIKEVEKKQWMVARHDGSWTHMDKDWKVEE